MKDKILVFVIGVLVGAIVTASGFLVYEKNNKNTVQTQNQNQNQPKNQGQMQMMDRPNGERPEPPSNNNTSKSKETTAEAKLRKGVAVDSFVDMLEDEVDLSKLKTNEDKTKYRYYEKAEDGKSEVEMTLKKD